jgi:hypothetical protein
LTTVAKDPFPSLKNGGELVMRKMDTWALTPAP